MKTRILLTCVAVGITAMPQKSRPNVIFIMADDLGWNDVGWHSTDGIKTPNLNSLLSSHSLLLNNSYVTQLCSPSRSALFTGFYPYRVGLQAGVFRPSEPTGVPEEFTFFPQYLQTFGYSTSIVGKWHLGYCNAKFLPTSRGFDSFYGYYNGAEDYFNHSRIYQNFEGLDFWKQDKADWTKAGQYSSEVFTEKVDEVIESAATKASPFFLYYAFQAAHSPLQVPDVYIRECKQTRKDRQTYCGIVRAMDTAIGRMVAKLKSTGLYENTIIIFSTDPKANLVQFENGGNVAVGGNNFPLRGNKNTMWEGGTRAASFLHSPLLLPAEPAVSHQLFSIVDWFPTILSLAGMEMPKYGDGVSQVAMIRSGGAVSARSTLVYNIFKLGSAVRLGWYKLIVGLAGEAGLDSEQTGWVGPADGWVPPESTHTHRPVPKSEVIRLFNLKEDPLEEHNIAKKHPNKVRQLTRMLKYLRKMERPLLHADSDERGNPKHFNGTYATGWC